MRVPHASPTSGGRVSADARAGHGSVTIACRSCIPGGAEWTDMIALPSRPGMSTDAGAPFGPAQAHSRMQQRGGGERWLLSPPPPLLSPVTSRLLAAPSRAEGERPAGAVRLADNAALHQLVPRVQQVLPVQLQ